MELIQTSHMLVICDDVTIIDFVQKSRDKWGGCQPKIVSPSSIILDKNNWILNEQRHIELIIIDLDAASSLEGSLATFKKLFAKDIPVIGILTRDISLSLEIIFESGITDYLLRPLDFEELSLRIRLALRRKDNSLNSKRLEYNRSLRRDVALARHIQAGVLPVSLQTKQINIEGAYLPAKTLGGDMYYWHKIDSNRYGIILVDIMGHGVATSLVSMLIRSVVPGLIMEHVEPRKVIYHLNRHMIDFNSNGNRTWEYYFSAIYLLIDIEKGIIKYVNGGMPTGVLVQGSQSIKLELGCPMLGVMEQLPIQEEAIKYDAPGHIFLFSDGLIDCTELTSDEIISIVTGYVQWFERADSLLRKLIVIDPMKLERQDDIAIIKVSLWE